MNPYRKVAASIIRLIALGMIVVPLILVGLDFFATKTHQAEPGKLSSFLKIGLFVLGLILLFMSGRIARKLTEDFEE